MKINKKLTISIITLSIIALVALLIAAGFILGAYMRGKLDMSIGEFRAYNDMCMPFFLEKPIDIDNGVISRVVYFKGANIAFVTLVQRSSNSPTFSDIIKECPNFTYTIGDNNFLGPEGFKYYILPPKYIVHCNKRNVDYEFMTIYFDLSEFSEYFIFNILDEFDFNGALSGKIIFLKDKKPFKTFSGDKIPIKVYDEIGWLESYILRKRFLY